MSMIKCRECKKKVSSEAKSCPHCGIDDPKPTKNTTSLTKLIIFIVFIGFISNQITSCNETQRIEEIKAKQKVAAEKFIKETKLKKEYFTKNRETILGSIISKIKLKEYQSAIIDSDSYLIVNDTKLHELNALAKSELEKKRKVVNNKKIKSITKELKLVPASEYEKNLNLYDKLIKLSPSNAFYKKKKEYYLQKIVNKKRIKTLLAQLKKIPTKEYRKNYERYRDLVSLVPNNQIYKDKFKFYQDFVLKQEYKDSQAELEAIKQKNKNAPAYIPYDPVAEEDCYDLGFRWGICSAKSLYGYECDPENDFSMPTRCRGDDYAKKGMENGLEKVRNALN